MKNLIKIENDCYFICDRIKEVDKSYEIFYNLDGQCYEVHSNEQVKNSYCFKIPFEILDDRTIAFAYKTRVANIDAIIREIDRDNQILYDRMIKKQVEGLKEALC